MVNTLQAFSDIAPINELVISVIDFANFQHPADLFTPLSSQPWAMWLDSCESDHVDSRFDIMVWQPVFTLVTQGSNTEVCYTKSQKTISSTDDPLALIEQLNKQYFNIETPLNNNLPFCGGALGYFSYDLGRRFEQLPTHAQQDIVQPDMAIGIYSAAVIYDRVEQTFVLIATPEQTATKLSEIERLLTQQTRVKEKPNFHLTSTWQANMNKAEYQEKFATVQNYLLAGDSYQINLAQRFSAQYQGDEFTAYLALRQQNKAPFSAFIRIPTAAILSMSPERFLGIKNNHVQTKPIKGTRPRSQDPIKDQAIAQELKHADKDRAENLMIVDLLRNDLSKACKPGSVLVPELFAIESFPAVHHLVSTVEGELEENHTAYDLLRGAFPGGSITGAPKIRAMEIIEELEPHRRHIYCGSIGYISVHGHMDTSITIRTLIAQQQKIHCWAGGGLVADSNVDSEYQETIDKVNKILPVLSALPSPFINK